MKASNQEDISKESTKNNKSTSSGGCVPNLHPQQQQIVFDELTLDSRFDSGNMHNAARNSETHFHVWIAPDCAGTSKETGHRTWFHFRVMNVKKAGTYTFTIKNMNFQGKLFSEGLMPVYKSNSSNNKYAKIKPQTIDIVKQETGIEVSFKHYIGAQDDETYFAFTFPWSYSDDQELLDKYEAELKDDSDIYFHRELLVHSKEERRVELVTISSHLFKTEKREKLTPGLFPEAEQNPRPYIFEKKKYVIISARVHPGELPSSHVYRGLVSFLLNKSDPRSKALRDNFVFVIIPILNPDGVYRGHYRSDTNGSNLNRYYINPNLIDHPSIFGAKQVFTDLSTNDRLYLYCDLHAHATKKGCFIFGNNLEYRQQVLSRIFPKLLSINSEYFEYESCCFSEKNLLSKEKGDGKDKEGAGRVALYKMTGLINCYTLECNYNSGKYKNVLSEPSRNGSNKNGKEEEKSQDPAIIEKYTTPSATPTETYTTEGFEQLGEAIGLSVLDMTNLNELSRLSSSVYGNLQNLKVNIALNLIKDPPFRFDSYLRKLNKTIDKNFDILVNYLDKNIKLDIPEEKKKTENPSQNRASSVKKNIAQVKNTQTKPMGTNLKVVNVMFAPEVSSQIPTKGIVGKPKPKPTLNNCFE